MRNKINICITQVYFDIITVLLLITVCSHIEHNKTVNDL